MVKVDQAEDDLLEYVRRVEDHLAAAVGQESAAAAGAYGRNLVRNGLPPLFDLDHIAFILVIPRHQLDAMIANPADE